MLRSDAFVATVDTARAWEATKLTLPPPSIVVPPPSKSFWNLVTECIVAECASVIEVLLAVFIFAVLPVLYVVTLGCIFERYEKPRASQKADASKMNVAANAKKKVAVKALLSSPPSSSLSTMTTRTTSSSSSPPRGSRCKGGHRKKQNRKKMKGKSKEGYTAVGTATNIQLPLPSQRQQRQRKKVESKVSKCSLAEPAMRVDRKNFGGTCSAIATTTQPKLSSSTTTISSSSSSRGLGSKRKQRKQQKKKKMESKTKEGCPVVSTTTGIQRTKGFAKKENKIRTCQDLDANVEIMIRAPLHKNHCRSGSEMKRLLNFWSKEATSDGRPKKASPLSSSTTMTTRTMSSSSSPPRGSRCKGGHRKKQNRKKMKGKSKEGYTNIQLPLPSQRQQRQRKKVESKVSKCSLAEPAMRVDRKNFGGTCSAIATITQPQPVCKRVYHPLTTNPVEALKERMPKNNSMDKRTKGDFCTQPVKTSDLANTEENGKRTLTDTKLDTSTVASPKMKDVTEEKEKIRTSQDLDTDDEKSIKAPPHNSHCRSECEMKSILKSCSKFWSKEATSNGRPKKALPGVVRKPPCPICVSSAPPGQLSKEELRRVVMDTVMIALKSLNLSGGLAQLHESTRNNHPTRMISITRSVISYIAVINVEKLSNECTHQD